MTPRRSAPPPTSPSIHSPAAGPSSSTVTSPSGQQKRVQKDSLSKPTSPTKLVMTKSPSPTTHSPTRTEYTAQAVTTTSWSNSAQDAAVQERMEALRFKTLSLIQPQDYGFEEEILQHPYSVKCWLRYLEHKLGVGEEGQGMPLGIASTLMLSSENAVDDMEVDHDEGKREEEGLVSSRISPLAIDFIYERAVNELPGSYKLWKAYLTFRLARLMKGELNTVTGLCPTLLLPLEHPFWEETAHCFERCLILCNKYPIIWIMYTSFMAQRKLPTRTRRVFDEALKALPITQHDRIWDGYKKFAIQAGGATCVFIWRRFLKLEPELLEEYVDVLLHKISPPKYAEAVRVLARLIENPAYASAKGKSHFQLWMELCDLVCEHPADMDTATLGLYGDGRLEKLDVDRMLRAGIDRFTDHAGLIWNALARWWILRGEFEKARDVFEEAMASVHTVKDFSLVFDAFAKMEEEILGLYLSRVNEDEDIDQLDINIRLARFEKLIERRPFLINDVLLRQNAHNVIEWANRVELCKGVERKVVETYEKALATISPKKAVGLLHALWIDYAKFFEGLGHLEKAKAILERAEKVSFKKVDDLAEVWCQHAEMEVRAGRLEEALALIGRATAPPRGNPVLVNAIRYGDESKEPQQRLFKSIKLWSFYVDLEESIGTPDSAKAVYDRIMDLGIATPQTIINFADFLASNKYFEESFKIYERGIEMFGYPIAFEIWNIYLVKFIERFKGSKLERARDLFEHALDSIPAKFAKAIYIMYAKLEEEYGQTRHSMKIYDRAIQAVDDASRHELFNLYLAKATQYFGLASTREIFEKAMELLPDKQARDMGVRFGEVELLLGEVDRARAILGYTSQWCDPRLDEPFWNVWHDFEVKHGNEDTFKEMLRVKRSVQAKFNTDVRFISTRLLASTSEPGPSASDETTMHQLEREATSDDGEEEEVDRVNTGVSGESRVIGFVRASRTEKAASNAATTTVANPDEIDIDDENSEVEDESDEKETDGEGDALPRPRSREEMEEDDDGQDDAESDENVDEHHPHHHFHHPGLGYHSPVQQKSIPVGVFGSLADHVTSVAGDEDKSADPLTLGAKERLMLKRRQMNE